MPRIVVVTILPTTIDIAFDLARSIDLHAQSQTNHRERAVAGRTSGLIELGQSVTWEASHFGVRQRLQSRVVSLEPPRAFRDSMVQGAFSRFDHDHLFEEVPDGTQMTDIFDYTAPLGPLGRLADAIYLERYMRRLLVDKAADLRRLAAGATPDELRARLG